MEVEWPETEAESAEQEARADLTELENTRAEQTGLEPTRAEQTEQKTPTVEQKRHTRQRQTC